MKKARDRHVWGIVQFHSYEIVDTTENLRHGLVFGPPQQFKVIEAIDQIAKPKPLREIWEAFQNIMTFIQSRRVRQSLVRRPFSKRSKKIHQTLPRV